MDRPGKNQHPIQRMVILGGVIFMLALCLVLAVLSYIVFSRALYERYDDKLADIITHVETVTDADDLARCLETREPSPAYRELQAHLNAMVDDFGLIYLYIVIPGDGVMINACSATSAAERAAGEEDLPILYTTDLYSQEELDKFRTFWNADGVNYFEESSGYGAYYTGVKPLRDSQGETVALICADVAIYDLHHTIHTYMLSNILMIVLICAVFGVIMLALLRRNVIGPILALEKSAQDFAEGSHSIQDFQQLRYESPDINTRNEVESLAKAVHKMAYDMQRYVENVLSAEQRAKSAEKEAESMTVVAYQDALTHVKSKAAYDDKMGVLRSQIEAGDAAFAIVMIDMNDLKRINDTYGHENGDKYLVGACELVCQVYDHSPVYRVGGDEFVVVLQGRDYEAREELFQELRSRLREACMDKSRPPWERYSAADGMAAYTTGETVEEVFRRADEAMYRDKEAMKNAARREDMTAIRGDSEE